MLIGLKVSSVASTCLGNVVRRIFPDLDYAAVALVFAHKTALEHLFDVVNLIFRTFKNFLLAVGGTMISATDTVSAARVEYL